MAELLRAAPRGCPLLCLDDWNVDQFPASAADPWPSLVARQKKDMEERALLLAFGDVFDCELVEPTSVRSLPSGIWRSDAACAPITRVPWCGTFESLIRPSCLDYALLHDVHHGGLAADWRIGVADHPAISLQVMVKMQCAVPAKRQWIVAE